MITWHVIGKYLQKDVLYTRIDYFDDYVSQKELSKTVLALCFHTASFKINPLRQLLKKVISNKPLAIFLAGERANEIFDLLLDMLSLESPSDHIMTYISDVMAWEEDFFLATWPAEERHDDWEGYSIIEIGGVGSFERIRKFIS